MHWFSVRPCAKISVLLWLKVCWCQKECICSTFSIKIRHEKSSYWISCRTGLSYYSAEPWLQPSQWTGLKYYPICLCWLFLQLILIRCQPQSLAILLLFFLFSVRLDDNKPLSHLRKWESCHSEVTTDQAFKGSDIVK